MYDFQLKENLTEGKNLIGQNGWNGFFKSIMNTIKAFGGTLDEGNDSQLVQTLDKSIKSIYYQDDGTENSLRLRRFEIAEPLERLFDGMMFYFSPKFNNTGDSSLQLGVLPVKQIRYKGEVLKNGDLQAGKLYWAYYENDVFNMEPAHVEPVKAGLVFSKLEQIIDITPYIDLRNTFTESFVVRDSGFYSIELTARQISTDWEESISPNGATPDRWDKTFNLYMNIKDKNIEGQAPASLNKLALYRNYSNVCSVRTYPSVAGRGNRLFTSESRTCNFKNVFLNLNRNDVLEFSAEAIGLTATNKSFSVKVSISRIM